jgi:hypothetical protein
MYLLKAVPIYPEGLAVVPPFLEGHDMVHFLAIGILRLLVGPGSAWEI